MEARVADARPLPENEAAAIEVAEWAVGEVETFRRYHECDTYGFLVVRPTTGAPPEEAGGEGC